MDHAVIPIFTFVQASFPKYIAHHLFEMMIMCFYVPQVGSNALLPDDLILKLKVVLFRRIRLLH